MKPSLTTKATFIVIMTIFGCLYCLPSEQWPLHRHAVDITRPISKGSYNVTQLWLLW